MSRYSHVHRDMPQPTLDPATGELYFDDLPAGWMFLGVAPIPRNRFEVFVHHVCHGLIMRYPLWKVLLWSWCNMDSFDDVEDE